MVERKKSKNPNSDGKSSLPLTLMGALFAIIGIGMLFYLVTMYSEQKDFIANAVAASGSVIELVEKTSSDSGTTYAPRFEYKDMYGNRHRVTSSVSSSPPAYKVGEEVEIFYDPEKPNDGQINAFFSLWGGCLILGLIGTVFTLVGSTLVIKERKAKQKTL